MELSIILSVVATTLALLSFCGGVWRLWRDRPRLNFYVAKARIRNRPDGQEFLLVQVKACNLGFRPIILTRCVFLGAKSLYSMGIHDEPAAAYGVDDQKFPSILEPGETLTFHPISVDALEKNQTDPKDPKIFHDPYKYMILKDSFGRNHYARVEEILWNLHLLKSRVPRTRLQKLHDFVTRYLLVRKHERKDREY
jgi:hypothetical protein